MSEELPAERVEAAAERVEAAAERVEAAVEQAEAPAPLDAFEFDAAGRDPQQDADVASIDSDLDKEPGVEGPL